MRLFVQNERRLYAYALTVLGDATDAEDVLQQASVTLWEKFNEFSPGSDFAAWAIRTVYFTAKNFIRKGARSRVLFSEAMFEAACERAATRLAEMNQVHDALEDCVEQLSPDDREMVQRRYELDASVKAMAQQQGRSTHAIYRSLARIHSILFDCVSTKLAAEGT